MIQIKTLEATRGGLTINIRPIRPQYPGTIIIKPDRVLLTPLDMLRLKGIINVHPPVLGTFASGETIYHSRINEPDRIVTYPVSCSEYPLIKREGFAAEITSISKKDTSPSCNDSLYPEFTYIYNVIIYALMQAKGETLVVGGNGLQTMMLASLLDHNSVITLGNVRFRGKTSARLIGLGKLEDTSWDNIIVWNMNEELIKEILSVTSSKKLLIHPFTACLLKEIPVNPDKHCEIHVLHPIERKCFDESLEGFIRKTNLHATVRLSEIPPQLPASYTTIIMRD